MIFKALDLLRTLGWGIISFIYSLIDSLFQIIRELNSFDIISSLADNSVFSNFHSAVLIISLTLFGLVIIWTFIKKIIDAEEGLSVLQILKEIGKCGVFIILSTFLFSEVATFSIKLSGFTANIFNIENTKFSDSMLELYVDYTDEYKSSGKIVDKQNINNYIEDGSFSKNDMYNDKFVLKEKEYIYDVDWIMSILVGAFFLYALFFSGMMLARRQIEFVFLFIISPIVFATSVNNKQRRSAVIEQLVSLTLQSAVVMLIINLTALVMQAVNNTVFFTNDFQNVVIKSLMFIGCGSFLLTGSQVVNRFVGTNVSANSGREQMMSLMSFGNTLSTATHAGTNALAGVGALTLGSSSSVVGKFGGDYAINKIGEAITKFGGKLKGDDKTATSSSGITKSKIGATIEKFGGRIKTSSLISVGKSMRETGKDNLSEAVSTIIPQRNIYRRRNRYRGV